MSYVFEPGDDINQSAGTYFGNYGEACMQDRKQQQNGQIYSKPL